MQIFVVDNISYFDIFLRNLTSDGGMSLLKHPSKAMTKLIQSIDRPGSLKAGTTDKALQRPVMAFVVQRHELDSLQLAMKQALRKAACRVYALQVRMFC